jgi:hypothetical protein
VGWHRIPRDNQWKLVTLATCRPGDELWLRCDWCARTIDIDPKVFEERHKLPLSTPFLSISLRLKCTRCGERKAYCKLKPPGSKFTYPDHSHICAEGLGQLSLREAQR